MTHQFGRARLRGLNTRTIEDNVNLTVTLSAPTSRYANWWRTTRCHTDAFPARATKRLISKLEALGHTVTLQPIPA
jgi:hypothetical protein